MACKQASVCRECTSGGLRPQRGICLLTDISDVSIKCVNDKKVTEMLDVSKDPQIVQQAGMMKFKSINVKSCSQFK